MYSITAHSLNIPQNTLLPAVYVAMHFSEDTYRPKPNHNFVNALVRSEKWPLLSSLAKKIAHKSIQEQLFLDAKVNTYFEVMQSRSISGLDQVLIPGDGDCLFTSSLLGAKNLGVVHTLDIPNAHALRLLLQQSLERKLLQARIQGLDSNGSNEIIDNFVAALLEHNELNSTSYTSYEQYIAAIGNPGVWAGHFELHLLPDILQANIIVHVAGRVTPEEFGGEYGPYAETIFLWHSLNHYNLLVHKWHGLPDSFEHMDASGAWHGAAKRAKLENRSKLHA